MSRPQPHFVPSTASASEILTSVAIQDLLAQDAESNDLPRLANLRTFLLSPPFQIRGIHPNLN